MTTRRDPRPELVETEAWVRDAVEHGVLARSAHVATFVDGMVRSFGVGYSSGRPARPDERCDLNCLTKPAVAMCLLELAVRSGLDLDGPLAEVIGHASRLDGDVTVRGIINHTTRLAQPSALDWMTTAPERRPGVADLVQEADGDWYSEVGAWIVAAAVIEKLAGCPAEAAVDGMLGRLGSDARVTPVDAGEVVAPIAGLPARPVPMLHVLHPTYRSRQGVAFGGTGSMPGYAVFLGVLSDALAGRPGALGIPTAILRDLLARGRPPGPDRVWSRSAGFALGFVHGGATAESAAGRALVAVGGPGTVVGVIDLRSGAALAAHLDGASLDPDHLRFARRQLLEQFLSDCDEGIAARGRTSCGVG